jgi:hypothetical protein
MGRRKRELVMQKGLAFLSVALTVGVVGVSAAACEDGTAASGFPDNGDTGTGGSADTGPGFNTDATPAGEDSGQQPSCTPSLPASFANTFKPPTAKPTACTTAELGEYFDACLTGLKSPKCTEWLTAHKTCGDCIEPDDTTAGPIAVHRERFYYLVNTAGCLSIVQKAQGGTDTCAAAYDTEAQCRRQSCEDCFGVKGGPTCTDGNTCFTRFNGCRSSASCKTYADAQDAACVGYKDADGGAPQCFQGGSEQTKDYVVRIERIFCGQ